MTNVSIIALLGSTGEPKEERIHLKESDSSLKRLFFLTFIPKRNPLCKKFVLLKMKKA